MDNPASLLGDGLAWYSMDGSLRLLRQIAQVSAEMSHDHMATADHFLTWKIGVGRDEEEEEEEEEEDLSLFSFLGLEEVG